MFDFAMSSLVQKFVTVFAVAAITLISSLFSSILFFVASIFLSISLYSIPSVVFSVLFSYSSFVSNFAASRFINDDVDRPTVVSNVSSYMSISFLATLDMMSSNEPTLPLPLNVTCLCIYSEDLAFHWSWLVINHTIFAFAASSSTGPKLSSTFSLFTLYECNVLRSLSLLPLTAFCNNSFAFDNVLPLSSVRKHTFFDACGFTLC